MSDFFGTRSEAVGEEFDTAVVHGNNPYPFYAYARSSQPIFYSDRFHMWLVTRYDDIVYVLHNPQLFSSEDRSLKPPSLPPQVVKILAQKRHAKHVGNTDPPEHTRLRQILNQVFTAARIAPYEDMIREIADGFIDNFAKKPIDFLQSFSYPFALTVILRLIGIPLADLAQCMTWCKDKAALDFASETLTVDQQCHAARASVAFAQYCDNIAAQRQDHPENDLVSMLLHTSVHNYSQLTAQEVSDLLPTLIFAGHETTANLIGNLLWQLLHDHEHLQALRNDPGLIRAAVEEGLRFDSPALGFLRRATDDVEVNGVRIHKGDKVFLLYGSGSHDESRWEKSECFHFPREHASNHLAFGHGIHFCAGAPLARLEARIAFERILFKLPGLRLADPNVQDERNTNLVLHTLEELTVTW